MTKAGGKYEATKKNIDIAILDCGSFRTEDADLLYFD